MGQRRAHTPSPRGGSTGADYPGQRISWYDATAMTHRCSALALLLASAPAFAADPASPYGVNAHLPGPQTIEATADAGFAWIRYDFNWFQTEPVNDQFQWAATDAAVDAAAAEGLNVFATLAYTPAWAAADAGTCVPGGAEADRCETGTFASVADWTDFVDAVVTRYGDRVKVFGMWNEPNLRGFYRGTLDQYVDQILVPGSAAVHAACADCKVAGPETAGLTKSSAWNGDEGVCALGNCIRNGWERDLGQVLDAAAGSLDVVTQHFYAACAEDVAVDKLVDGEFFGSTMTHDSLRGVLLAHGGAGKPVWLTETGWQSQDIGEADQAAQAEGLLLARKQLMTGSYAPAQNDPFRVDKIFFYEIQDDPNIPEKWGLIRADGSLKPSYDAVAAFIAANPPGSESSAPFWNAMNVALPVGGQAPQALDLWSNAFDAETASDALVYTLVDAGEPKAGVTIVGGRWLSVVPDADWTGTTLATVRASDGILQTDASVLVAVGTVAPPTPDPTPPGDSGDAGEPNGATSGFGCDVASVAPLRPPLAGAAGALLFAMALAEAHRRRRFPRR